MNRDDTGQGSAGPGISLRYTCAAKVANVPKTTLSLNDGF